MLVLTRKSNQSIMIGDDIEVSVLSIMGEKVRIGIQAPRDIPVFRKEVYLEIQAERGQVTVGAAGRRRAAQAQHVAALERRRRRRRAGRGRASAHDDVERLEHRHGHDDRGRDEHEHEHDEARRAALVRLLDAALLRAHDRLAAQRLPADPVVVGLLVERALELREALSHPGCHALRRLAHFEDAVAIRG